MSKIVTNAARILLVDDHTLFRESLARLLEAEGYVTQTPQSPLLLWQTILT
jgi:CheY-like chemotaxis protein